MKYGKFKDSFVESRKATGLSYMNDQNDPVTMVLGHVCLQTKVDFC